MSRRKRNRRSRRGGNDSILLPILLYSFCAVAIGAFLYYKFFVADNTIYDEETLCAVDGASGALTVLIDTSDPISVVQKELIAAKLKDDIAAVATGTLIAVSPLGIDNTASFWACKPVDPQQVNQWVDNPRMRAVVFEEKFMQPLNDTLQTMMVAEGASTSPIMESILPTILRAEAPVVNEGSKTLIMISDMIQNSENFSFFRGESWTSFQQSEKFKRLGSNLSGYDVRLYLIPREQYSAITLETLQEFWRGYFDHQRVSSIKLERLGDL